LNYITNRKTGVCRIEKLKGGSPDSQTNGSLIEIRDPTAFFDFDNAEVHFVGLKRIDGILTNVWIGKKKLNGKDSIIEWHFLAQTWNKTEWTEPYQTTPLKIIIFTPILIPGTNITGTGKFTNNVFYFSEHELNIYEFNIRACLEDKPRQTLSISISSKYSDLIKSSLQSFRRGFVMAVKDIARVTILRISPPRVAFAEDEIIASFTIFERSEYGDVIFPKDDVVLKDAVQNLNDYFTQSDLEIKFMDDLKRNVSVVGLSKTLNDHFESEGIEKIRIGKVDNGYSGTSVVILAIVILVLGSLFGLILTILHKQGKIKLPLIN
ncbi:EF-hand domain-containing D1, partial [Brachionus plicatilis]